MEIKFTFDDPHYSWNALGCARLLCDIQHICLFALYLSDNDVEREFDVFDESAQTYLGMIEADGDKGNLSSYAIKLWRFSFRSPPEISVGGVSHKDVGKLRAVIDAIKRIVFFEAQRKKQESDAEFARQRAIGEALKNYEHVLNISKKIKDPLLKEKFERNLLTAIQPFCDGRHPGLRDIELDPPR